MVAISRDSVFEAIGRLRCCLDRLKFNATGLPAGEDVELVIREGEDADLPTYLMQAEERIDTYTDTVEATLLARVTA